MPEVFSTKDDLWLSEACPQRVFGLLDRASLDPASSAANRNRWKVQVDSKRLIGAQKERVIVQTDIKRSARPSCPMAVAGVWLMALGSVHGVDVLETGATTPTKPAGVRFEEKPASIWEGEIGSGFRRSTAHAAVVMGLGPGLSMFGSPVDHNLVFAGFSYGKMWGETQARDHWWRGNFEWRVELLTGGEFSPSVHYFVGLTPHLRYNFDTGSRWIPFLGIGCGASVTSIGLPDLGGPFQFNSQASAGVNYLIKSNLSLCLDGRDRHVSSAGIYQPNAGMNNVLVMAGVNWFY
jgi:hypothetical protein